MTRSDLARTLAFVAGDLDRRLYPYAGVVRQAARALLEVDPTTDAACPGCGEPVEQTGKGRPRKYHGEACRSRARRR